MKNDSQSPNHEELKALLASSFHAEEADDVPPLPDGLKDRIRDQYGMVSTPEPVGHAASESFFSKLLNFFAQPAYSGAAAAILLLAVAVVMVVLPDNTSDEMRDTVDETKVEVKPTASLFSYGFDNQESLGLDKGLVVEEMDSLDRDLPDGPSIIIDGVNNELKGYSGPNAEPIIVPLPAESKARNTAIAGLIMKLGAK